MGNGLKVAVAGAGGIGKHHANWHHQCGSQVVAILGRDEARCEQVADSLTQLFGFSGRCYTDLSDLLERERPDIVDICTPNAAHYEGAARALEAGSHVLCEKPVVWEEPAESEVLLGQGRRLADLAVTAQRHLAVCTQYAACLEHYQRLCGPALGGRDIPGPESIRRLDVEMETLARGRNRTAREIWVDMGSHPLSLLLAWRPDGEILASTAEVSLAGNEARAVFDYGNAQNCCQVDIAVRDRPDGVPVRRFGINGALADCSGRPGDDGLYRSVLSQGEREEVGDDFMHRLIRQFTAAVLGDEAHPLVTGATGLRNLQLQLELLAAAQST